MKQHILAAGFDFEFLGTDFNVFCTHRMDRIIAASPGTDARFILFNFKEGTITAREITYAGGTKKDTTTIKRTFDKIGSLNYVSGRFKNGQRNTLSVTHIYDAVCDIGNKEPGTLQELSFFSHAWFGGAIFVNSFDDRSTVFTGAPGSPPPPSQVDIIDPHMRDPDDKDSRGIDFASPTMDVNKFRAAFRPDGFSWIWGCTATDVFKDLINTIIKMPNYTGAGTKNTEKFTLFLQPFLQQFKILLGLTPAGTSNALTVTFADVKTLLCKVLQSTYAFKLAFSSNKKVHSSFVGVGSTFEAGSTGLMKADVTRANIADFYKTHLGIKSDPEGRNYAEYLPTLSCTVPAVP